MEMNDYYKILDLKYKYTAFGLFRNYLKKTKVALLTNNKEEFIKIRMGFEVLRDEGVIDDYNRLYRKYVLNQDLNYPSAKEAEMVASFQEKEKLGTKIANEVIADKETYSDHLWGFIFQFILEDIHIVWGFRWGLAQILSGIIVLLVNHQEVRFIFCPLLILYGCYNFRRNMIRVIMPWASLVL